MDEFYYEEVSKLENFFDAIIIVDQDCIVRIHKTFAKDGSVTDLKESIGKKPWEVFLNLKEEDSTLLSAVKYDKTSIGQNKKFTYLSGDEAFSTVFTYPIKKNKKIIGAVSAAKFVGNVEGKEIASKSIHKALSKSHINVSNMTITRNDINDFYRLNDIIGNSEEIQVMKYRIQRTSMTNSNVLIYGESGTGKEMVAQSIHSESSRKSKPFISQNCAAIPNTLLESIFFGTTKGSFTGAEDKPGIFELANGGTLFFDEINSMDLNM